MPIAAVMSSPVIAFAETATVAEVRERLRASRIHGAPVVDGDGVVRGMISRGDVARALEVDPAAASTPVSEVMMCFAFFLPLGATLAQAAALMAYEGVHRVVVVDRRGRPVGVVSTLDVAARVAESAGYTGTRTEVP